jgi:hypothetical protein
MPGSPVSVELDWERQGVVVDMAHKLSRGQGDLVADFSRILGLAIT